MANEPLEVVFTVDDETMAGLKSAIGNVQDGVKTINNSVTKGMSQTMGNAEQIMRTRTGSIMMLMTRLTARIVEGFDKANSQVASTFYKYQDGANIAKSAMLDLAMGGGAGLDELGKNIAGINQELGYMFSKNYGSQAEQILTSLTSNLTKLNHDTGVSVATMTGGFKALVAGGLDTQQAMDVITQTVVTGNGQILDSFKKIGEESPESLGRVTQAWVNQLGGIQAVQGATQNYMEQNRTFSENMASLWASVQVALQPLMESLNRISSFLLPYIQQGLLWIRAILDSIPDWVKDVGMMVLLMTTLGTVVNFVASQFANFGGLLGLVISGFQGLGKIALFPFIAIGKGISFVVEGFVFLFGVVKKVFAGIAVLAGAVSSPILAIGAVAVGVGAVLFGAFQPFHDLICAIISKVKSLIALLGGKVKGAVDSFKGGGRKGGGMKAPSMPKMRPTGGGGVPFRNLAPQKPKSGGGGGRSKPKKQAKPKDDKAKDKALKAQKKLADRQAKIERDLTKKLQDEFNRRKDAYMNFVGFFEGVNRQVIGISNIIKNLQSQQQALTDYTEAIHILQVRLGDSEPAQAFIAELEKLGPSAVDQIQALAFCSDEELAQVVSIFQAKSQMASDKAGEEVAKLEPKFRKEVEDANKSADTEFDKGGKKMDGTLNKSMGKLDKSLDMGMGNLNGTMGTGWGDMLGTSLGGAGNIATGVPPILGGMTDKLRRTFGDFGRWWTQFWSKHGVIGGILYGLGEVMGLICGFFAKLVIKILGYFEKHKFHGIGKNILNGLWEGIKGGASWLHQQIAGFCNGVIDGFKRAFRIHSPSRVMKKLGLYIAQGLGIGMEDGYDSYVDGISDSYKNSITDGYDSLMREAEQMYGADLGGVNQQLSKNAIYTKGLTINVERMNCKDKEDTQRIARELYELERRNGRIYGGMGRG